MIKTALCFFVSAFASTQIFPVSRNCFLERCLAKFLVGIIDFYPLLKALKGRRLSGFFDLRDCKSKIDLSGFLEPISSRNSGSGC
jgi:hypothetical protein